MSVLGLLCDTVTQEAGISRPCPKGPHESRDFDHRTAHWLTADWSAQLMGLSWEHWLQGSPYRMPQWNLVAGELKAVWAISEGLSWWLAKRLTGEQWQRTRKWRSDSSILLKCRSPRHLKQNSGFYGAPKVRAALFYPCYNQVWAFEVTECVHYFGKVEGSQW